MLNRTSTMPAQRVLWHLREAGLSVSNILDIGIREETNFLKNQYGNSNIKQYLFEPMREWHSTIEENYKGINHELVPIACSDEDGKAEFISVHEVKMDLPSHGHLRSNASNASGDVYEVETQRLDTFVEARGLKGPFLLKIDVDGFEMNVLKGAIKTLKVCDVVIVEMTRRFFAERTAFLHEQGFFVHSVCDSAFGSPADSSDSVLQSGGSGLLQCDVFFLPNKFISDPRFTPVRH